MRLAMVEWAGQAGLVVMTPEGPRGLAVDHPEYPGDLDEILARGADLRAIGERLREAPLVRPDGPGFLPPLRRPGKIVCVGFNYRDHSTEAGVVDLPDFPSLFARFASTLTGHGQAIELPSVSSRLDYEGELAVVIGGGGRGIAEKDALGHVAGYSIFNDASIRDYQFKTSQWLVGKNFDRTGGFGPWLVPPDELPPGGVGLRVQTRLNSQVMQEASTSAMIFNVAKIITIVSEIMTLSPGDVIITGTPSGVGYARPPPVFMKAGDVCEVEIEGIGVLRNQIERQKEAS